jgi:hypothetical protein
MFALFLPFGCYKLRHTAAKTGTKRNEKAPDSADQNERFGQETQGPANHG